MTSTTAIAVIPARNYKYNICRTCLKQDLDMKCIFNSEVNSVPVYQMLFATTPVEIKSDDGLPNHLCSQCIQSLINAYKFQKMSIDNDFKLRNYLTVVHRNQQSGGGRIINFENLDYKNNETQAYELADDQDVVVKIESDDDHDDNDKVHASEEIYKQLQVVNAKRLQVVNTKRLQVVNAKKLQRTKTDKSDIWSSGNKCIQLDDHDYFAQEQNDSSFNDLLCCNICYARFEQKCVYDRHMQMHVPKLGQLSKTFARKPEKPVTVYLCNICKTAFGTEDMLNLHKKVHERPRPRSNEDYIQRGRVNMTFGKYNCTIQSKNSNYKASHVCNICKRSFKTWEELTQHISEHQIKILYGTEQGSNTTVNVNVNIQTEKMHECKTCSKSFNTGEELKLHEKEHIPTENIPAITNPMTNDKEFEILSQLESQIKARQEAVSVLVTAKQSAYGVKCEQCGIFLSNSSNLRRHVNRIHNRNDVAKDPLEIDDVPIVEIPKTLIYKCKICNQEFVEKSLFLAHEKSHLLKIWPPKEKENKLLTSEVEIIKLSKKSRVIKIISSTPELSTHPKKIQKLSDTESTHAESSSIIDENEEKEKMKIKCLICATTFNHPKHMLAHLSVHNLASNGKAYTCTKCMKEFTSISAEQLKNHNETHSKQNTADPIEYKYKCELCPKKFNNRPFLISHILTHNIKSDGITYSCSICNEEIDSISAEQYKEHNKKHAPEEIKQEATPSEIIEEKTLKQESKLQKPDKKHKSKVFTVEYGMTECHLCSGEFISHYTLKRHLNNLHRVNAQIRPSTQRPKKMKKILSRQPPMNKILRKKFNKKVTTEQSSKTTELPKRSSVKRILKKKNPDNKCDTCEKVFFDEKHLNSHKKTHQQKEMPVLTPIYLDTTDLSNRRETDIDPNAPYQCSVCLSNLKRGGLTRHLRERHGKVYDESTKEYCRDCKLFLENEEHLEYHKLNVHAS